LSFRQIRAGAETKIVSRENKEIIFSEDYGVPGGFVIGILFPENYAPFIMKFKEKPYIPSGYPRRNVTVSPPGQFQLYYNRITRQAGIAFLTCGDTFFGFKVIAKPVDGEFPLNDYVSINDPLEQTIRNNGEEIRPILRGDIQTFCKETVDNASIEKILEILNELRMLVSSAPTRQNSIEISKKTQILRPLLETVNLSGSLTTMLDSYYNGGIVEKFISKIMAYVSL
jgi:hypothetical protein